MDIEQKKRNSETCLYRDNFIDIIKLPIEMTISIGGDETVNEHG